jgi:RNA 3'-terminal phosphate cyclase-like protein
MTDGSKLEINKLGTYLRYYPGLITNNNGTEIEYDCGAERCLSYFLEPILILGLFGKAELSLSLSGITNCEEEISVDSLQSCLIPLIKKFNKEIQIDFKITQRGYKPNGSGKVHL